MKSKDSPTHGTFATHSRLMSAPCSMEGSAGLLSRAAPARPGAPPAVTRAPLRARRRPAGMETTVTTREAVVTRITHSACGPLTDWGELVQVHDDRKVLQDSPEDVPSIDIRLL